MRLAVLRAWLLVPTRAALVWVVAAVLPLGVLELEPRFDDAGFEVDVLPTEAEGLALADTQGEGHGPAGTVRERVAATSRIRRASSRVSGSVSGSSATGASMSVATLRPTLSRRTATVSAETGSVDLQDCA